MSIRQKFGHRSFFNYSEEAMENAIAAVKNGMTKKRAAISFSVPRTTLIRRLKGTLIKSDLVESSNILTAIEEDALEKWIISLDGKGFPIHKHLLLSAIKIILDKHYRPNPFDDNIVDNIWLSSFMKRHSSVLQKYTECPTHISFDKDIISKLFHELENILEELLECREVFDDCELDYIAGSMEDGDGNIKTDAVQRILISTPDQVNDIDDALKVNEIFNQKKNKSEEEVNTSKEGDIKNTSISKDLTSIEASNKVNGELEYPKKSDPEEPKFSRINDANENELDQSVSNPEINSKPIDEVKISRKRKNQVTTESLVESEKNSEDINEGSVEESQTIEYKGFKKRILAQAEKLNDINNSEISENIVVIKKTKPKIGLTKKTKLNFEKDHSQQEYAQYLGLQPTVKFKCYRCSEKFQTMALLQGHQRICGSLPPKTNHQQAALSPVDPNLSTNFRITRKVYLCSACGTYYENWNLFLHMRDVHKRHICLFCLGMFSVADKLAEHLVSKHSIHENIIGSSEEFLNVFKGSCFLMCCTCEKIFTERDDFYGHHCTDPAITALNVKCPLCGVKCGHFLTCPNNTPHSTTTTTISPNLKLQMSSACNKSTPQGMTVTKYLVPISKSVGEKWNKSKSTVKSKSLQQTKDTAMEYDEDYDISNAASFCHVDIGDESTVSVNKSENKTNSEDNSCQKQAPTDSEDQSFENEEKTKQAETPIIVPLEPLKIVTSDIEKEDSKLKEADSETDENAESSVEATAEKQNKIKVPHSENVISPVNSETYRSSEEVVTNTLPPEIVKNSVEEGSTTLVSDLKNDSNLNSPNNSTDNNTNKEEHISTEEKRTDHQEENCGTDLLVQDMDNVESQESSTKDKVISEDSTSCQIDSKKTIEMHGDLSDDGFSDAELEPDNISSKHDSDYSRDSSEEQSIHEDDNKHNVNGGKSDSDSEDSDKLSLVVDDKPKNCSDNESLSGECNKNTDEKNKESDFDSNLSNSGNQDTFLNETNCPQNENSNDSNSVESKQHGLKESKSENKIPDDGLQIASDDVPAMALTLEDKLDEITGQAVIKECVRTSCTTCVYCSHAVKIAVNGKQLALHLLAEHRYTPIKNETTEDVVIKLKKSLPELENVFFNTDSYDSSDKSLNVPHDQTYECFQCHFVTKNHKELYLHKKKMHQKTILLCVMCKSNFYSYSELLCHMCPGIYVSEDIMFRCCYCNLDQIPSAFRLMVHLRKSHHTCDICLEVPGDQQKLSTHMWKHKLHHLCYKCGIAYRNKPDITKHLFWKHGTESVLCKKCLQKKWPHVYHFCIPPTVFICEECNASFSRAVALKVHKRLHGGDSPYVCNQCEKKFISKKLLTKHEDSHNQVITESNHTDRTQAEDDRNTVDDKEETINVVSLDDSAEHVTKDTHVNDSSNKETNKTETQDSKSHKKRKKDKDKKNKHVVDVYDLPPLNLSSESDDSEDDNKTLTRKSQCNDDLNNSLDQVPSDKSNIVKEIEDSIHENEDVIQPVPVVDGVWDNFHSYKAQLEKREALDSPTVNNAMPKISMGLSEDTNLLNVETENSLNTNFKAEVNHARNIVMADHDYCLQSTEEIEQEKDITEPEVQIEKPAPREHSSSIDHDYCSNTNAESTGLTTTPVNDSTPLQQPLPQLPPTETPPSQKKKVKTPKKKLIKHNSSSSSDSSSDSDSSSCSCGTNCSCSSSSSNSSSSSSSDSESSSSEGRLRAAARKERKKEKTKLKQEINVTTVQPPAVDVQPLEDEPIVDLPVEPIEVPIQESDLDTDETLTDEDFYDQHPQRHANQLLAEKRNQLMLLAAVAPVNNGNVSPSPLPADPPPPPPPPEVLPPVQSIPSPTSASPPPQPTPVKRKVKSKKRKKSQILKNSNKVSSTYYNQPSTSFPSKKPLIDQPNTNNTMSSPNHPPVSNFISDATPGSGSETDSTRLSKRKRVRNKFYGYSSDEEEDNKPPGKWRKVEPVTVPQQQTPVYNYQRSLQVQRPVPPTEMSYDQKQSDSSASEDEEEIVPIKKPTPITSNSSSSSSESDNEVKPPTVTATEQTEKSDNLYCYCQCPYDEVSEMIACDGLDCTIEWFHFECVGIMVPPKGKWYCPDCRKRRDLM